ncbi:WD repeat-containing protein 24 [Podospora aff. communis PSN243]|uniref:WD repeat-containing protein 24 n=1 Tax=Podospora aff. communis PSN243 TaxID=3040156 RepID=A0AAV9GEV5_9PEZI|nr:WD repeat-containing protein 24 [Podospora aff. communis PSN243]
MEAVYSIGNQGRIMRRLLGRPTVDSSHESAGVTSSPLSGQYRPSASQNAVFPAGAPIACLDRSPNGLSAVLAGRHTLKTVNFDGLVIREGLDLRALLANNSDQLSIRDVKWGTGHGSSTIFTACAGGKIFQYDLMRAGANSSTGRGIDHIMIRGDSRQVNTLDINPHRGTWLLSGSQDGIVRCFDIRTPTQTRTGPTFPAVQAFKCNADGVRHVQWSPKDGFYFACGTEQGVVLKWDIRKAAAPVLRINAHDKTCSSIAWHPDGEHLVSAGWDSKCHVWDMSKTADKRQKPKWTISTPAPVATLAWRPGQWSATAQGKRASQIAVSYDDSSQKRYGINAVHIWDLARPTMPYRELQRFDSSPSAILWHDQYLLWTAGQDGLFNQCDVTFAPKVIDRQAVSTLSFSSRGDVLMFLDERASPHRPRPHILQHESTPLGSYSSSPATPRFSVSRSDSEDDVIGSFLGPRRRGSRRRRPSTRSAGNLSTTPPTGSGLDEVLSLEQTIKVTGTYKPHQAMAIGHVPAGVNVDVYEYLTVNYLETLHQHLPHTPGGKPMPDRVHKILEHYASAAEKVNQFRLAQTWRILAYGISLVLKRRAQYHFDSRMESLRTSFTKKKSDGKARVLGHGLERSLELSVDGEMTPRKVTSSSSLDSRAHSMSLIARELESTSNVPTPLARPIPDDSEIDHGLGTGRGKKLTPIIEPESFTLPPAIHEHSIEKRKRLDSEPLSVVSHDSENTHASTEGYDFYGTEAITKAVDVPFAKPSVPPVLGYTGQGSPSRARKPVLRQDSDESFAQVFSISDGSRRATGLTNSSDGSVPTRASIAAAVVSSIPTAGSSEDGEFASRIRGKHIQNSPSAHLGFPVRRMLERTDTNFSTFTDEHHLITQTTSDSFESPYRSQTDTEFQLGSPVQNPPSIVVEDPDDDQRSPYIIERDYLCWPNDPPYPHPLQSSSGPPTQPIPPLQPYTLISRALAFEAKSSALNASAIVLLLKPLIPDDVIDSYQAAAILRQHHTRLMSMKLFVEAALLRKLCMRGWPGGVLSSWGEDYPAIFNPAHQGVQAGFLCPTCRKPREIDRTSNSTDSVWRCNRCKSLMAPCAVCGHRDVPPDIPLPPNSSDHHFPPKHTGADDEAGPILTTWWYCPGCSHGGHSSCLQAWHAAFEAENNMFDGPTNDNPLLESSDGCCPFDGCGHACLPGRGREETLAARSEEVTRAVREATRGAAKVSAGLSSGIDSLNSVAGGIDRLTIDAHHPSQAGTPAEQQSGPGVRSDGNDVPQSQAVQSVRETLGSHGLSGGQRIGLGTTSILSSSPGRGSERTERERRKSVKFVATTEER